MHYHMPMSSQFAVEDTAIWRQWRGNDFSKDVVVIIVNVKSLQIFVAKCNACGKLALRAGTIHEVTTTAVVGQI